MFSERRESTGGRISGGHFVGGGISRSWIGVSGTTETNDLQAGGLLETPKITREEILDHAGEVDRQVALALIRAELDKLPPPAIPGVSWTDIICSVACCSPDVLAVSVFRGRRKLKLPVRHKC